MSRRDIETAIAPLIALIDPNLSVIPVPAALLRDLADASLPKKHWTKFIGEREWLPWGGRLRWRTSPTSKKVWSIGKKNDQPRDIHIHHQPTLFGASCLLEDFVYLYEPNVYMHFPSGRALTARQIARLFPADCIPHLNGEPKHPALFIRRHNRRSAT